MTDEAPTADEDRDDLDADDFPGSHADDPVSDDDLPYVVLFAGVAPEDAERVAAEYEQAFAELRP